MKKVINPIAIIAVVIFISISCEKEQSKTQESNQTKTETRRSDRPPNVGQGECAATETNLEAIERGVEEIDLTHAYSVESEILPTTEKGTQYISDYYQLSSYAFENAYILSEFDLHYNAIKAGINASNNMLYGSPDDIVFDEETYDNLYSLVSFYMEVPSDEIIEIATQLEDDLTSNYNVSKEEVLIFLEE